MCFFFCDVRRNGLVQKGGGGRLAAAGQPCAAGPVLMDRHASEQTLLRATGCRGEPSNDLSTYYPHTHGGLREMELSADLMRSCLSTFFVPEDEMSLVRSVAATLVLCALLIIVPIGVLLHGYTAPFDSFSDISYFFILFHFIADFTHAALFDEM